MVWDWDYSASDLVSPPNFFLGSDPPPPFCVMKREGEREVKPHSKIMVWDWAYSASDLVSPPYFIWGCGPPPPSICIMKREGGEGHTPFWNHGVRLSLQCKWSGFTTLFHFGVWPPLPPPYEERGKGGHTPLLKFTSSFDLFANFRRRSLNKVCSCSSLYVPYVSMRAWITAALPTNILRAGLAPLLGRSESDANHIPCAVLPPLSRFPVFIFKFFLPAHTCRAPAQCAIPVQYTAPAQCAASRA